MSQFSLSRSTKRSLSVLAALVAALGGGRASAELWVYEGFQYEPFTQLMENLEDPGSLAKGFSGGWTDISQGLVQEGGLSYGTLLTHGGSLWHQGTKDAQRSLDVNALPPLAGLSEIWISFLLRQDSIPTIPTDGDLFNFVLSYPRVGPTLDYRLTIDEPTDSDTFGFRSGPLGGQVSAEPVNSASVTLTLGETKLIVFKLSLDVAGTNDFGQMFVNPIIGQSTPGVNPIAESTMNLQKWFSRMNLGSGPEGAEYIFDEIRMGSSYADVTPTVPEPSSLLLLGTAGAALIGSRRRRKAA